MGGAGGGRINITALISLKVDGTIDADGQDGTYVDDKIAKGTSGSGGGGSGGSVLIQVMYLEGKGVIRANGGDPGLVPVTNSSSAYYLASGGAGGGDLLRKIDV
jgi:hypothetical protein